MNKRFFENKYKDYSEASVKDAIINNKVRSDSIIYTKCYDENLLHGSQVKNKDYTVYTGTAGIALYYLRKSERHPHLLEKCFEFLPHLHVLRQHRVTFLCGDSGPLAISAVAHYKLERYEEMQKMIDELLLCMDLCDTKSYTVSNELLYGRAGYLYSLLFVNAYINPPPVDSLTVRQVIHAILEMGKKTAATTQYGIPLMYKWQDKPYLGAAHGLAGILYILLQAREYLTPSEMNELVKPTLDHLPNLRFPSGNYWSNFDSAPGSDRLVQWCHGAPGFTHLFCEAYKIFREDKYLELALKCGDVVWEQGLIQKGFSLCHGVAGNAYSFLELYRTTKDVKHLYRATKFSERCIEGKSEHEMHKPDNPVSLFEGITGVMCLAEDMKDPENAKFPGYTV